MKTGSALRKSPRELGGHDPNSTRQEAGPLTAHPPAGCPLALTLLVYLAMSAATSAEAVAMGRSALIEEARVLVTPELVTRGDD